MTWLKYVKEVSLAIILLLVIGLYGIWWYEKEYSFTDEDIISQELDSLDESVNEIADLQDFYVEIKGAVNAPGVYLANENTIINDIVNMAGGFKKTAYTSNINLSKKVSAEMVIYVYTESEYTKITEVEPEIIYVEVEKECNCPTYDVSSCINNGNSTITPGESEEVKEDNNSQPKPEETDNKININTASKAQLMTLSGIGEAKATNIIAYRTENGLFASIADIKKVSGISDNLFEKIKDYITI